MNDSTKNLSGQILEEEKEILKEEKEILKEIHEEETAIKKLAKNAWILTILVSLLIVGASAGLAYWKISSGRIYTDKAEISAPHIDLAPQTSGTLEKIFVKEGDFVNDNTVIAQVGEELIKTKTAGIIIKSKKDIGKLFNRGEAVATMIDPNELRVVAKIDEDKGLSEIRIGQTAKFTVDAFSSKEYEGVVDSISPVSSEGDIVFNISDKRQVKQFEVKVRFDVNRYPELKDGMSAKLWIYK
jgi:multidrug resistance efflux pump